MIFPQNAFKIFHRKQPSFALFGQMVALTKKLVTPKPLELQSNDAHIQNPLNKCNSMIFVKYMQAIDFGYNSRLKFDNFIALSAFLVTLTKSHISQRPFELKINAGDFWNSQNDHFQRVKFQSFQGLRFYHKQRSKSDHFPPKIVELCSEFLGKVLQLGYCCQYPRVAFLLRIPKRFDIVSQLKRFQRY